MAAHVDSRRAQCLAERHELRWKLGLVICSLLELPRVSSGQDGRARGRTLRRRRVGVVKNQSATGEPVDIGRLHPRTSVGLSKMRRCVVSDDEENVGFQPGRVGCANSQLRFHCVRDLPREKCGSLVGEVDVICALHFLDMQRNGGVEVVDGHAGFGHDFFGDRIVLVDVTEPSRGTQVSAIRYRSCCRKNEFCACFTHLSEQFIQILFVLRGRRVAHAFGWQFCVVQSKVEMNHVPLFIPEPSFQILKPVPGGTAVGRRPVHVGDTVQQLPCGKCVTDRYRVADEQHAGQSGDLFNRSQR